MTAIRLISKFGGGQVAIWKPLLMITKLCVRAASNSTTLNSGVGR